MPKNYERYHFGLVDKEDKESYFLTNFRDMVSGHFSLTSYVEKNILSNLTPETKYLLSNGVVVNIGFSFKFILKVGVEESIVNAPLVHL
jgi:hypothetical protein